jgi:hypothetical protein
MPDPCKKRKYDAPSSRGDHEAGQDQDGPGPDPTMRRNAYVGYLESVAKCLRRDHGEEGVAQLRRKILLQMEILEQELGRPLAGHELFDTFRLAIGRFLRTRHLAQMLYRKDRSS